MTVYYLYWILTVTGMFFLLGKENDKRNFFWLCFYAVFVGFSSGVRWKTGTDWDPYHNLYFAGDNLSDYIVYYHFEFGFKLLNWFFNNISSSYTLFLSVTALFVFIAKYYPVYKRPYASLFVVSLLGVSLGDLFSVRQSISIAIGFLAIYHLSKGRSILYVLLVLIAFGIHKTALVLLLAYPLIRVKFNQLVLLSFISSVAVFVLFSRLIEVVRFLYPESYFLYQTDVYMGGSEGRFSLLGVLYRCILLIFILHAYKYVREYLSGFELYAVKLYVFILPVALAVDFNFNMFSRLVLYFSIFEIVVVPAFFYYYVLVFLKAGLSLRLLAVFLFVFFYFLRFYSSLLVYWDLYIPYQTIFNSSFKEVY